MSSRRHLRSAGAVSLAAIASLLLSGCLLFAGRHWEETRQSVIEPINSALHRHLPRDIKARDLEAVLQLYATETGSGLTWDHPEADSSEFAEERIRWTGPEAAEPIRHRYEQILERFADIDKAELRIHRIHWKLGDERGFPADVRLLVRGLGPDGSHRMLDQHARVWIDKHGRDWVLTGERVTNREMLISSQPQFEVVTEEAGIDDVQDTTGAPIFRLIGGTTISSGSTVADVDCDGLEDLVLAGGRRITVYRNDGDGSFTEISAALGLPTSFDLSATGLVAFDADNDGDPDLWVSGIGGERFYRNDGCIWFEDATAGAGIGPTRWSSMPIVADYDRDGYLDVYVVRMGDHANDIPKPNWEAVNGSADGLYHNEGNGTFRDVTDEAGIHGTGWGLAGAWGDYDDDGYPDVYVGNEFGFNALYHNEGDGTFVEVAEKAGVLDRGAAMGATWGDYDDDGHLDLFVSNMYANSGWALLHPDYPPPVPWYYSWVPRSTVDQITSELVRGSTLLHNEGDGTFTDVSDAAGVRDCQWGWAAEFLDYNNDGRLDIYATNGFVSGPFLDDV